MSGFDLGTAMDALFMIGGGGGFARLGWSGLKRRVPAPAAGEPAPPPMSTAPLKALWLFCLLFGAFILVCGLLLAVSAVLPGNGS